MTFIRPRLLNAAEAGAYLNVGPSTVRTLLARGELESVRMAATSCPGRRAGARRGTTPRPSAVNSTRRSPASKRPGFDYYCTATDQGDHEQHNTCPAEDCPDKVAETLLTVDASTCSSSRSVEKPGDLLALTGGGDVSSNWRWCSYDREFHVDPKAVAGRLAQEGFKPPPLTDDQNGVKLHSDADGPSWLAAIRCSSMCGTEYGSTGPTFLRSGAVRD